LFLFRGNFVVFAPYKSRQISIKINFYGLMEKFQLAVVFARFNSKLFPFLHLQRESPPLKVTRNALNSTTDTTNGREVLSILELCAGPMINRADSEQFAD
jgi:hypothetical protein